MPDPKPHPLTTQELQLLRQLVDTMLEEQQQWGRIYPRLVEQQLEQLHEFYQAQNAKHQKQN